MNIGVVGDESYDVPWEFNKKILGRNNSSSIIGGRATVIEQNSKLNLRNKKTSADQQLPQTSTENLCTCRISSSSYDNNIKNTPPCGVKAKEMKSKHIHGTSPDVQPKQQQKPLDNNYIVWKYRGPDTDARPSSDYDLPWNSSDQRVGPPEFVVQKNCTKIDPIITKDEKNSSIGSTNSADSGVYDEPWDKNCQRFASSSSSSSKNIKPKNDQQECCLSSPCTSRSASSQGSVSVSSGSRETLNNSTVNLKQKKNKIETVEAATNTTSRSTLQETAFCSKINKNSSDRENIRLQDIRDRLIQQLCNSSTTTEVKTAATPTPAVRRSKLKSLDEISPNDHHRGDRRSMDNDARSPPTTTTTTTNCPSDVKQQLDDLSTTADDNCTGEIRSNSTSASVEVYDIPWEFSNGAKLERLKNHLNRRSSGGELNDDGSEKRSPAAASSVSKKFNLNRQHLQLNFGCAGLNPVSEKIDAGLSLDQQPWYHGNVTRADAEQRLRTCKEGSYLVRVCESAQSQKHEEYALSLKSAKGYMHMKIQLNADKKWILGYFSHPFDSISKMIRYYSVNKLPIKGAEHMCLIQPIVDQVL